MRAIRRRIGCDLSVIESDVILLLCCCKSMIVLYSGEYDHVVDRDSDILQIKSYNRADPTCKTQNMKHAKYDTKQAVFWRYLLQ